MPEAQRPVADEPVPALSPAEERKLGELLARRSQAAGGATVRLKVEPPHSEVTFGGVTVGAGYADVPAHLAADIIQGSAEAGVKITQES